MRWLKFGLMAVVGLGLSGEAAARYLGFGKPLLYQGSASAYELVPNQSVVRLRNQITINNIGTRGPDVSLVPATNVLRVLVLGDSVANGGTQLRNTDVFSAVASREVSNKGCKNEILNASAGGWSIFDETAWIEQHGLFGATIVAWTLNSLDLDQAAGSSSVIDHHPSVPSKNPPFATWEIATRYVMPKFGSKLSAADSGSTGEANFNSQQSRVVIEEMKRFRASLASHGVKLIVIYHQGLKPVAPARRAAEQRLLDELEGAGEKVILTGLAEGSDAKSNFLDAIHPNAKGHSVIGKRLGSELLMHCRQAG